MNKDNKEDKTEQELAKEVFETWLDETLKKYDEEKSKKK